MKFIRTKTQDNIFFDGIYTQGQDSKTVIIDIHGLSWDFYTTNFYNYFYENFPKTNINYIAGETRGSYKMRLFQKEDGNYHEGGGAFEIFEDSILDIEAWINKAVELGYENIYLSGYSFGPTKTSYYYYKTKDSRIKGLIFISPSDIYGLTHYAGEIDRHTASVEEAKQFINQDEPKRFLTRKLWDIESFTAQTYLSLFENKNTQIFNYFNPELKFEILSSIDLPVLAITGTKDEGITIDHEEAMKILTKALNNSSKVEVAIFEGAEHSFDKYEQQLFNKILAFVNSNP
jgi:pimeloyl-ACP methyl ester carboxylesterase